MSEHSNCSLRPLFSKAKEIVKRPDKTEISCIQGPQKVLGTRIVRGNRLQRDIAIQSKDKTPLQDLNTNVSGALHSLNEA